MMQACGPSARFVLVVVIGSGVALSGCFGTPEDQDGLETELEREGWLVTVTDENGVARSYRVTSSPYHADQDGDGLSDAGELLQHLDPRQADTDGDGLLDDLDITIAADDPLAKEWAGKIRYYEQGLHLVFLGERGNGSMARGGEPTRADTDKDGIIDGDEAGGFALDIPGTGKLIVKTNVHSADTDGDGILDGQERRLALDPTKRDTDGDGVHDRADVNPWFDVRSAFRVTNLTLHRSADVWFRVNGLSPQEFYSAVQRVGSGDEDLALFSSAELDTSDDGGSVLAGRHNVTFLVQLQSQSAGAANVDVFSDTTGRPWVQAQLQAVDGSLSWLSDDGLWHPWPHAGFAGPAGALRFVAVLTNPVP